MSNLVPALDDLSRRPRGTEIPYEEAGFAARLREATKAVHREAERTGFIADLIRGRATRAGYALFLRNLVPVYAALEARLDDPADLSALLSGFAAPGLRRLSRLVADLETIHGPDWRDACALLPEAEVYADAIEAAARGEGARLAAHAYARYLGDLSGGQILKPLLARTLHLGPTALGFYDFPAFPDLDVAKRAMRNALDTVEPEGDVADGLIEEAIAAFRHNIDISLAVSRATQAAVG